MRNKLESKTPGFQVFVYHKQWKLNFSNWSLFTTQQSGNSFSESLNVLSPAFNLKLDNNPEGTGCCKETN